MTPFRLGLTGSIATGKSTAVQIFRRLGVPVWEADATVHRLYAPPSPLALAIKEHFPDAIDDKGGISRPKIKEHLRSAPEKIALLNQLVHPLVARDRFAFIASHSQAPVVVLDIPLLFEIGAEEQCDAVLLVTTTPQEQRSRVLARGLMSIQDLEIILSQQMPQDEKRQRADYVIETLSLEHVETQIKALLASIHPKT